MLCAGLRRMLGLRSMSFWTTYWKDSPSEVSVCMCVCWVCKCFFYPRQHSIQCCLRGNGSYYVNLHVHTFLCASTHVYCTPHLRPCASFHGACSQRAIKEPILQRAGEAPVCWGVPEILQLLLSWRAASRASYHQNRVGHRHFLALIT